MSVIIDKILKKTYLLMFVFISTRKFLEADQLVGLPVSDCGWTLVRP